MSADVVGTVHGLFVSVWDTGVLLLGESGSGKSDLALALVDRGHQFIADDVVAFSGSDSGKLVGCSPEMLKHQVAVRGLGVVDLATLYGKQAVLDSAPLALVIHMQVVTCAPVSLEPRKHTWMFQGVCVPAFDLCLSANRPRTLLIEALVRLHYFLQKGKCMSTDFLKKHASRMRTAL